MFGWSKHQFESKFRELLKKMGFERGIVHMASVRDGSHDLMKLYFANAPKARDFVIAFNGMVRRASKGAVASVATEFNKMKVPTGTVAIVTLDLHMLKGESFAASGESLFEWLEEGIALSEAAVKVGDVVTFTDNRLGMSTKKKGLVTSVSGNFAMVDIGSGKLDQRVATKDLTVVKGEKMKPTLQDEGYDIQEGGVKAALEDWMYALPKAAIEELRPIMKQKFGTAKMSKIAAVLKKHGVTKNFMGAYPAQVVNDYYDTFFGESVEVEDGEQLTEAQQVVVGKYRFTPFTEGSISGHTISIEGIGEVGYVETPAKKNTKMSIAPFKVYRTKNASTAWDLKMVAYPGNETKIVSDKEVRYAPRQLFKAVAMWMDKHGKVMVEENQSADERMIAEDWWRGTDPLTKKDADGLLDDLEKAYKKGGLNGTFKVPNGDSGPLWEMIEGLEDFLRNEPKNMIAYVLKGVKDFLSPADRSNPKVKKVFEAFDFSDDAVIQEAAKKGSFAAYFKTKGDSTFATNELRFATKQEAEAYARNLFMRWLGASEWKVEPHTDAPNYVFANGRATPIKEETEITEVQSRTISPKSYYAVYRDGNDGPLKVAGPYSKESVAFDYHWDGIIEVLTGAELVKSKWKNIKVVKEAAEQIDEAEFKSGDTVKVPHKGKMVKGKIVRFDSGGTSKAQQHGGGYIVDVGEPASILVPAQKVQKEETEITESNVNLGTNAYRIQRTVGRSTFEVWRMAYSWGGVNFADGRKGTLLRSGFKSYEEALAYAKKDAGVKEEVEEDISEKHNGLFTDLHAKGGPSVVTKDGKVVAVYRKERSAIKHAATGKPVKEDVEEAFAPSYEKLLGSFVEKAGKKFFDYRLSQDDWGKSHGLPHEVCVKATTSKCEWRSANVKGTVCYIALDEGADGKPILDKWNIIRHQRYVKGESVEQGMTAEDRAYADFMTIIEHGFDEKALSEAFIDWSSPMLWMMLCAWGGCAAPLVALFGWATAWDIWSKRKTKGMEKKWEEIKKRMEMANPEEVKKVKAEIQKIKADPRFRETKMFFDSDFYKALKKESVEESVDGAVSENHDCGCKTKGSKSIQAKNKASKQAEEIDADDWKSIHEGAVENAQALAKEIKQKARELGVTISVGGSTSVSFSKTFTKGSKEEFFKAYSDCDKIRDMVRFKSRVNEWGASSGGMGLGAQDDIKNGRVTIHKSGDGAAYLLKALSK